MPYYHFKEFHSPLRMIGVRFFVSLPERHWFIKIGDRPRKRISLSKKKG